ncbi:acyl-CoA dehydrogenase family protein [uncultured Stenotrophomonas sp.]|uniref:acyl-CoA dehydrogenase family protein n=1 Tax=uncultured Stenotrophomonas sp. TaxID=165438 RepID=UPI0025CD2640|nr:acyl-CoA dehydrogenase family protein [uncultured Stenotrophomonas sp.]
MSTHFRADLQALRFHLWNVLGLEELLGKAPFHGMDRARIDALLERGLAFAEDMAQTYRSADVQGCSLDQEGRVRLPDGFDELWKRWLGWEDFGVQAGGNDAGRGVIPAPAKQLVMELLMGANPAFMCFGGFTPPATRLIRMHGTPSQKAALLPPLEGFRWDACYCATEAGAGSDLLAIRSTATELDGGIWGVVGEKLYITAGFHELTENTLYIVLARPAGSRPDSMFLSCYLVPRRWWDEDQGCYVDNNVRCTEVTRKMGMRGCPNTRLRFGEGAPSRGWLLGDRCNAGMLQFATLARHARVNSAIFATGLASTAYLNSVEYAQQRIQGRRLHENAVATAPRQPIAVHADVKRMLLDMRCRLEASRSLVSRVTWLSAQQEAEQARPDPDADRLDRWARLASLLVPISKTWTADQAWKICETAMQVHGGIGYTEHMPVEQYLRDVKILSIWEGTSYIQSLTLVRDGLAYGRSERLLKALREWVRDDLHACRRHAGLAPACDAVLQALDDCLETMAHVRGEVAAGRLDACSAHFVRIVDMFGTTLGAWGVLQNAAAEQAQALHGEPGGGGYGASLDHYLGTILPLVRLSRSIVAGAGDAPLGAMFDLPHEEVA